MKHLYIEEQFLKFNQKRSTLSLLRATTPKKKERVSSRSNYYNKLTKITAPDKFSILYNTTLTLNYFYEIEKIAIKFRKIYIDISKVQFLSPETVLYLLLILEKLRKIKTIKVGGNAPIDDKCRQVFLDSGFYDFVNSKYHTNKNTNVLSVRSENYVDGEIANQVIEFAMNKLSIQPSRVTRAFYTTILECMGNTKEHAYASHDAKYAKWWLIAQHDSSSKITFAILDNGKGIPETVRKKLIERVFGYNDSHIIRSVLIGEFRTATELKNRGKGLPKYPFF